MNTIFKALYITEEEKHYKKEIIQRTVDQLPEGEVLIQVHYSSLNYKDALSASGNKGVTRSYPHTPGIDAAGVVVESTDSSITIGEEVIVTGYDLGMNTCGGLGQYIRVPAKWVVKLPKGLTLKESMYYGTAGLTAAICVDKLIAGVSPSKGDILVTGATGGVATIAIKILVKLGYSIVAATGKVEQTKELLLSLGVKEVIERSEVDDASGRPLLRPRWAGVIDTVGGNVLATAIKTTHYDGIVCTCGNAGGIQFTSSVFPFILKGITLCGIDSVEYPMEKRIELWNKLADGWKSKQLDEMVREVTLEESISYLEQLLEGTHTGRTVVTLQ